jgi:hypothetical protein
MVSPPGKKVKLSESPNGTPLAVTGRETHAMNITDEIPNPQQSALGSVGAFNREDRDVQYCSDTILHPE